MSIYVEAERLYFWQHFSLPTELFSEDEDQFAQNGAKVRRSLAGPAVILQVTEAGDQHFVIVAGIEEPAFPISTHAGEASIVLRDLLIILSTQHPRRLGESSR